MPIFWIISLIFGIIVITNPDFIAYIIGFFFLFVGINILVASWMMRRKGKSETSNSWKVGGYEIIKNKK
jgi:uncharacterized membrane protein HdeD (DUF308 family)